MSGDIYDMDAGCDPEASYMFRETVTPVNPPEEPVIPPSKFDLFKRTVGKDLNETQREVFIDTCNRLKLDPFNRQIYAIKRGGRLSIETSVDGFRLIAQRTGEYRGQVGPFWCAEDGEWKDVWLSSKAPAGAKVGVLREGFSEPLVAAVRFDAFNGKTPLWRSMPEVMLAKVAEVHALRRAFPRELSGVYTGEEMAQADTPTDVAMTEVELLAALEKVKSLDEVRKLWNIANNQLESPDLVAKVEAVAAKLK